MLSLMLSLIFREYINITCMKMISHCGISFITWNLILYEYAKKITSNVIFLTKNTRRGKAYPSQQLVTNIVFCGDETNPVSKNLLIIQYKLFFILENIWVTNVLWHFDGSNVVNRKALKNYDPRCNLTKDFYKEVAIYEFMVA